jgi:hypothetical protein
MRFSVAAILAAAAALVAVTAVDARTTTQTTRVVEFQADPVVDDVVNVDEVVVTSPRRRRVRTKRRVIVHAADDDDVVDAAAADDVDDDIAAATVPSDDVDVHLRTGSYEIYRNPLQLKSRDQLRDLSGRVLYSLKHDGIFSRGFTLYDKSTNHVVWRARSGGVTSWSRFTSPHTHEEVRVTRRRLHWHYKFRFSYHGRTYTWEQVPSFKYRMALYRTTPGRAPVKLLELHRTFLQAYKRANVKVTRALIAAIRADPSLEGLVIAMALRLNEEIKTTQIVKTAGALTAFNALTN